MFKDQIDTQKGIAYLAGKKEIYLRIVGTFTKQKEAKVAELNQFFAAGDFNRLTIEFHGLKSSSATLGSTLLPEMALELEMAGKNGEHDIIKQKYEAFIEQYKDTCDALNAVATQI